MAHISTAWLYSGLLSVLVISQTVQAGPSTQSDINNIAKNLKVTVYVTTNHLSTGTYEIAFHLSNVGNQRILNTDDWEIIFSLHNRNLLTKGEFVVHGFSISEYKESLYKMQRASASFPGLNMGQAFKITIQATGLSVFKHDILPRFIVRSPTTIPQTIVSTDDDGLGFVQLTPSGNPSEDFSKMTGVQRTLMVPDVLDMERVPPSIVVPPPNNITIDPRMPLLNLSSVNVFYVWPDKSVSGIFIKYFRDVFSRLPGMRSDKLQFVNSVPPATADKIYIQQATPEPGKSRDYYKLAIRPRVERVRDFNLIHMSAISEEGLHNAVESLVSAAGLYELLPDLTIEDDARFGHRSLSLDLTKNFIPLTTLTKVLKLMSMYKLNKLELTLGDDYAWRLDIPDIPALSAYASKRCLSTSENQCLLPYLGSGAEAKLPGSGSFSLNQFSQLIKEAASYHIEVIPRFNFLGGLLSAKRASEIQYTIDKRSDPTKAERFYLNSPLPSITPAQLPEDVVSVEGLLDPCRNQTYTFINTVINRVYSAFKAANVSMRSFHAGGDELTQFLGLFPSCRLDVAISSTADALRFMIGSMQSRLATVNAVLHVNEEAITDPSTGDCLTTSATSTMTQDNLIAHFYKTFPGSPDEWNLSQEQFAYMDGEVVPPDPTNPNSVPDPLRPYNGPTKGLTSWILPYRCANRGYKVVLKPENFFALDQAYELDFDEPGNRKMRRFHIINMHRMMMYEPLNHYMNMDLGKDGYTFLQYRMCKLFPCETLTRPENILGLTATLDTSVVRTENMLWHMLLPRLLCFAEKAWRKGEHEGILKAEVPSSLVNQENLELRSGAITMEINNLMNNIAYKEGGRLDHHGFNYRVPTLGASIHLGLVFNRPPPYPLMFKADMPALEVQIRDLNAPVPEWKPLFYVDPNTDMMTGGYTFNFPDSNQKIELRALSSGGRNETERPKRPGRTVTITGSTENYLPREIPVELRNGTCLPIEEPWTTDINNVTSLQWRRILQNIQLVVDDQRTFMEERQRALQDAVNTHNSRYRDNAVLPIVFTGIEAALISGQNISLLPQRNVIRTVYERDMDIYNQRARDVETRLGTWQQEYLQCQRGLARPFLLPESRIRTPGRGAVGGTLPGGGALTGRPGAGASARGQSMGRSGSAPQGRAQGVNQTRGMRGGQAMGQGVSRGINQGQSMGMGAGQRARGAGR